MEQKKVKRTTDLSNESFNEDVVVNSCVGVLTFDVTIPLI